MQGREPVAVTGLGVVTPAGATLDAFWMTLRSGRSTATSLPDAFTDLPVRFAAQVPHDIGTAELTPSEQRRSDRFTTLALVAARRALADADLPEPADPGRCGVYVGCGFAGIATVERTFAGRPGQARLHPTLLPRIMPNAPGAVIAIAEGWRGPNLSFGTVCAASSHAIGEAARVVADGHADVMLAGGAEAPITPFVIRGFHALSALSTRNDCPEGASRPFAADRDGFVLGEGAAFVVLERLADARARGARIYANLAGYASTTDAFDLVMPAHDGAGAAACMCAALADADLGPRDVVHVNAHGTSTPRNDAAEAAAIRDVLGPDQACVTSIKGGIGHLMGAAGAAEFVAACLTLHHREAPPTANTTEVDPDADVDLVTGVPRPLPGGAVLSNSFAFGGQNACLVVIDP